MTDSKGNYFRATGKITKHREDLFTLSKYINWVLLYATQWKLS